MSQVVRNYSLSLKKMVENNSKLNQRWSTSWLIFIPLLVSLFSFAESSYFIPYNEHAPVQTELSITPAKTGIAISFSRIQPKPPLRWVGLQGSFRYSLKSHARILSVRFAAINSEIRSFKSSTKIIAFTHAPRHSGNIIIFQA